MPKKKCIREAWEKIIYISFFKVAFQVGENSAKITLGPINCSLTMWPYVFLGSEFLMIEAFEGVVTDAETERRRKFVKLPKAIKMDETVMKI